MIALAYYLLKVIICSGLLFLYYQFALRNKLYHQWNRFYLVSSVALSLLIPCFEFNILQTNAEAADNIQILYLIHTADAYVAKAGSQNFLALSAAYWPVIAYSAICFFLFITFLSSLRRIQKIIASYPVSTINNISFVNTEERSAPFSFFHFIFWNKQIDINSSSGQLIFQHELVHVREKHTLDKIFIQLVLIAFWCNPFFWLIRKELKMIHEFIADKKALGQQDASAFAAMILSVSFPNQQIHLTNQFFQSPIKRRLIMLTKEQKTRISYASRILALPVVALLAVAFTVKAKSLDEPKANSTHKPTTSLENVKKDTVTNPLVYIDGVEKGKLKELGGLDKLMKPEKIKAMYVYKGKEAIEKYGQKGKNGVIEIFSIDAPPPPPPPAPEKEVQEKILIDDSQTSIRSSDKNKKAENPLVVVDGNIMGHLKDMQSLNDFKGEDIASISVYKGTQATNIYGDKAKDGVIVITTKSSTKNNLEENKNNENDKVFEKAEVEAQFPGGVDAWRQYLQRNLDATTPVKNGAPAGTYTVIAQFIVHQDGSLSDIKTLTSHGHGMEAEVIRILAQGPKWIPAEQNGQKVVSYRKQPITFVIQKQ